MEKHGYHKLASELNRRIWNVVDKFKKFLEFARGGSETEPMLNERIVDIWDSVNNRKNRIEQPPQEIQAWSVSALLSAKYKWGELQYPERRPKDDPLKSAFEDKILAALKS